MVDDEIRSEGSPSTITIDIPGEKPRTRPNSPELPVRSRPSSALHPETQPSKTLPESPAAYTPPIRPPPNTPATNAPARAAYAPALSPYEPALDVIVEAPAPAAPMPDPVHTAWKVAQIGMMLRKHKDSSALRYLQRSLHLDPAAGKVWRLLGHARAKDGQLQSACAAFRSAIVFDPETDLEARTALATLLAQMGKAAASADELLKVRSLDPNFGFVTEPLERLCRRLMPAQRFACIQSPERTRAWREALISMAQDARILDMSSTPLPALLAVCCAEAHRPVLHVSHLPQSIAMQLLNCNGSLHAIELLPAGSDGLPEHNPSAPLLVEGSTPNLLVVDSDAIDILASSFLTTVRSAKAMVHPKARVMPCTLEVHVALVESNDLMQMNAMTSEYSCGFDLSAVNAFSHRSRLVRLSQLSHRMLTRPSALIRIPLDGDELSENGDDVLDLKVELSGTAHAIVVWHTLWLTSSHAVSTGPQEGASDATVRQVAYYIWPAAPGEPDWAEEGQNSTPFQAPSQHVPGIGHVRVRAGDQCRIIGRRRGRRIDFQLCAVQDASPTREPRPSGAAAAIPASQTTLLARSAPDTLRVSGQNTTAPSSGAALSDYHFPMLNDAARNRAFAGAIQKAVCQLRLLGGANWQGLTLDIGCGTGLLAMYAARAGASHVLAIEMAAEMASLATTVVSQNKLDHAIRVLNRHSSSVDLVEPATHVDPWERKAELLVFEILGTDPLCEGLLPALRDARARLLRPDAVVIPCGLEVHAVIVQSEDLMRLNAADENMWGVDLSAITALSHRTRALRLTEHSHVKLTQPAVTLKLRLDTLESPATSGENEIQLHVERSGVAHAVIAWFTCHLDNEISISTAPGVSEPMRGHSWGQMAHFVPSMELEKGEILRIRTRWTDKGLSFGALRQRDDYRGPKPMPRTAEERTIEIMKIRMAEERDELQLAEERDEAHARYLAAVQAKLQLERENAAEVEKQWRADQVRFVKAAGSFEEQRVRAEMLGMHGYGSAKRAEMPMSNGANGPLRMSNEAGSGRVGVPSQSQSQSQPQSQP